MTVVFIVAMMFVCPCAQAMQAAAVGLGEAHDCCGAKSSCPSGMKHDGSNACHPKIKATNDAHSVTISAPTIATLEISDTLISLPVNRSEFPNDLPIPAPPDLLIQYSTLLI